MNVCHDGGAGWQLLPIPAKDKAVTAHLNHGDALPGQPVPGLPAYSFTVDCVPILGDGLWLSGGQNLHNTRSANAEATISPENVADLQVSWVLSTDGDVSATPAVDGQSVYFPDWAGNLYKVDRDTGEVIWSRSVADDYTGIPGNFARTTPAVYEGALIFGDQGGRNGVDGARVMSVDADTGDLLWSTIVGNHPFAIVTQSATVFDDVVYVGVSSFEESLAEFIPGYDCCSFQGSMMALDANTGAIIWETKTVPTTGSSPDYSGSSIWGSNPVVDTERGAIYVATGNNYSVPDPVSDCIVAAGDDEDAQFACLDDGNLFDAVLALDMGTGEILWSTVVIPFDVWTVSCLFVPPGTPNCPDPAGPGFDFGQAPVLYDGELNGEKTGLLGIGQKSGQFWALNADTGEVVWSTQVGPGGVLGGIMWGSAYDGDRLYTAISNVAGADWHLIGGSTVNSGGWAALDPATGEILWQTPDPAASAGYGAVTVANGVLYACSLGVEGNMYAIDAATGNILWTYAAGGSCASGAAVVNGSVYWGTGYTAFGAPGNRIYSFTLP
jgi:polyvinyl alcohol dehydrogenase (cytochrome)